MRALTGAEVLLMARVLMLGPARFRAREAAALLEEVRVAGRHLAATGQAHQAYGDGSLAARCHLAQPSAEPLADDPEFLASIAVAAKALLRNSRW